MLQAQYRIPKRLEPVVLFDADKIRFGGDFLDFGIFQQATTIGEHHIHRHPIPAEFRIASLRNERLAIAGE